MATWHNRSAPYDTHTHTLHTKVHMVLPSHWTSVHNNMQKTLPVLCGIRIGVAAKLLKGRESRRGRKKSEMDHIPQCALPAEHCGGLPYPSLWDRDSYSHMGIRHQACREKYAMLCSWMRHFAVGKAHRRTGDSLFLSFLPPSHSLPFTPSL